MAEYGIDFSFGSGLTVSQIKAAGKSFVVRYLSGGNPKDIDKAELDNYLAGGIRVCFVWETTGQEFSKAQGIADAHAAQAELNSLGAGGAVVFFAQDVPVAPTAADQIAYDNGASSVIGFDRMGGYGDFDSIKARFDAKSIKFGWQTYGGSNNQWDDRALLRQYRNNVPFGPATVDLDEAAFFGTTKRTLTLADDFGQWPRPSSSPPPATGPVRHVVPHGFSQSLTGMVDSRKWNVPDFIAFNQGLVGTLLTQLHMNVLTALRAADDACEAAGIDRAAMPQGAVYYTKN